MEVARQRALVLTSIVACKKEKEEASTSAPKVVGKGSLKRKNEGKANRPLKKGSVILVGNKQKKLLPFKPNHGAGKGLMTATGPVTQGIVRRLLTHKEHTVKMVESIIKDVDLDPCTEQMTEESGASGLFDLSRVCLFLFLFFCSLVDGCLVFRPWCI